MPETSRIPFVNPVLTGIAREFKTPQLLADQIAPPRTVPTEIGQYVTYGVDDTYVVDNTYAHGAIPNAIVSREAADAYVTEMRVLRHAYLDKEKAMPDGAERRRRYTRKVTLATQVAREYRVAQVFTNPANYLAGYVLAKGAGAEWDAAANLNSLVPINDMNSRISLLVNNGAGLTRSNLSVVIPADVFEKTIRFNTGIRDFYKYTQSGVTTEQLLAGILGVKEVLIANGQFAGKANENTSLDITSGIPRSTLWSDNVWIGATDDADLDLLCFARQMVWDGVTGTTDIQIRQYPMADIGQRGDWIEAAEQRDVKITANFAGALVSNVLA